MQTSRMSVRWCLVLAVAVASSAFAQASPQQAASSNPPGRREKDPLAEVPVRQFEAWELEVGVRVWMRMQELKRLHQAIEQRVNLTPEQMEAVAKQFDRINERLRGDPGISAQRPTILPPHSAEKLAELEATLKEAKAAGNEGEAEKIQLEIRKGTPGTNENVDYPLFNMINEIKTLVRPDQLEALNVTMDRWHALEIRSPFDGPLRMIARAVEDPDLKLTLEQDTAIKEVLKSANSKLPAPGQGKLGSNTRINEEAEAAVFQLLSKEQRTIVEQHVASFRIQYAELEAIRKYRRGKRGNPSRVMDRSDPRQGHGPEDKRD